MGKLYSIMSALLVTAGVANAAASSNFEYWIDNNYSTKTVGSLSPGANSYDIDLSGFRKGLHRFNYRMQSEDGSWGAVFSKYFYSASNASHFTQYEYWLDKDYENRVSATATSNPVSFDIDLSGFDKSGGAHYFNLRARDDDGDWGAIYRKLLVFNTSENGVPIIGYRHYLNDVDLGYVKVDRQVSDSYVFEVDLPDDAGPSLEGVVPTFDGNKVSVSASDSIKYLMQIQTELGWTLPTVWNLEITNNFSTTAIDMAVNSKHAFDTPKVNEFAAIRFLSSGDSLYFKADIPVDLDIYKDGAKHTEISGQDLNAMTSLLLPDGEYFALLHGPENASADKFTFQIMDSYKTSAPYGEFDVETRLLTLKCDTENASIFYTFDLESEWIPYTAPISISGNGIVYVKATSPDFDESEIAEIVVSDFKCTPVSISYDGRYIVLSNDDADSTIRYSIDGTEPSSGMEYTGAFDVAGLCVVRAVAIKEGFANSDVCEFQVDRYADEDHAQTSAGGLLESCFEWSDSSLPQSIERFSVEGNLNDADFKFLNSMQSLRHLDLEKVNDAHIPDYAFSNSILISISLPADLAEYGDSIFSSVPNLSSLIWNSEALTIDTRLSDGLINPNILVYVPQETSLTEKGNFNIVVKDKASSVTLHYGNPYFAARDFRADYVSLTRDFNQPTEIGVCRGWETLVLPFSPDSISHSVNGPAVPFAAWDGNQDGMKPFWLYRSTAEDWEEAAEIEACVPYIISMPNNPDYVPSANLSGSVTFSATNADLGPESSLPLATPWKENTQFVGIFMPVEEEGILSLNVNANGDDLLPGSTFVPDDITIPFGAYVSGASTRNYMPVFGDGSGIKLPTVTAYGIVVESPAPGMLRVSSASALRTAIFTPDGATVRTIEMQPGEVVTVEGLTRGLYICAGIKVIVR